MEFSAAATLRSSYGILKEQGIRLVFVAVADNVKAELDRLEITDLVGEDAFFTSGDALLKAFHQQTVGNTRV